MEKQFIRKMKSAYMEDYIKYICLFKPLRYINNSLKTEKAKETDKRSFNVKTFWTDIFKKTGCYFIPRKRISNEQGKIPEFSMSTVPERAYVKGLKKEKKKKSCK